MLGWMTDGQRAGRPARNHPWFIDSGESTALLPFGVFPCKMAGWEGYVITAHQSAFEKLAWRNASSWVLPVLASMAPEAETCANAHRARYVCLFMYICKNIRTHTILELPLHKPLSTL